MTDTYKRDGYHHVRQAIPPAHLESLRACIQREVGNYANEMLGKGEINSLHENLPFGQRLAALHREYEIRLALLERTRIRPRTARPDSPPRHRRRPRSSFWVQISASMATTICAPRCPTAC